MLGFDRQIARWSPEEFIDRIIVETLHAGAVVVGANFRFGAKAAGEVATLVEAGATRDFETVGVALDGGPQVWSSTYVRQCLATGDVAGAAEALGRAFVVRGTVVEGDKRGRELGYPTANVPIPPVDAAPADGVYAGWLTRLDTGERYPAAISVGTNPTFDGERERRVESYVLDRDDLELYGVRGRGRLRRAAARDGEVRRDRGAHRDHARRRTPRARDPGVTTEHSPVEEWFLAHGLPYFVAEERAAARAGLRPRRLVPLLVVLVVVAAGAGVAARLGLRRVLGRPGRLALDHVPRPPLVRRDGAARAADPRLRAVAHRSAACASWCRWPRGRCRCCWSS